MNGFALTNTASGRIAILLPAANDAAVIRNGTILASGGATSAAVGGATGNKGDGIHVSNDSLVTGNTCDSNGLGTGGDGAGIHATASDNRIESNNVTDNDRGIDVDQGGNLIIKNSASGSSFNNYEVVANNVYGAIVDRTAPASAAVSGNSAAASAATTDPWANFSF
ncbi:MAG: hypothetical protein ABIR71_13265 [Chthoniobacterales bacterium]